jgi:ParB family chromosome partitioning protein
MAEVTETPIEEQEILKTSKNDLFLVDPRNVEVEEGFNIREDLGDLDSLLTQILEQGQIEAVVGFKKRGEDKFILTDGHRRHAAFMLGIERGHAMGKMKLIIGSSNAEDRLFAMVTTGIGKKPLTVVETAEAYKRLINLGYKAAEIARKVGNTSTQIGNLLKLADVPKEVKNHITNGYITATTVIALVKETKDDKELVSRVNEAVDTVIQTEFVETDTATPKAKGKQKKATAKNAGILTPKQKLDEVARLLEDHEGELVDKFWALYQGLTDKTVKVKDLAALFKS